MNHAAPFYALRDFLLANPTDYDRVAREYQWPVLDRFNWAFDVFDRTADPARMALGFAGPEGITESRTFAELTARSSQVANAMAKGGVAAGDRILLMLPNSVPLWETVLGAMKLGAVIIPAAPQLTPADLADRFERGQARHVVTDAEGAGKVGDLGQGGLKLLVGEQRAGWTSFDSTAAEPTHFTPPGQSRASDPLLLYFTSGTTAKPKLVLHTHASYPVGHLATMYWLGVHPGDRHLNISSPGWAKHAWSSVFAPWNAGATILVFNRVKVEPRAVIETIERAGVTTFCGPPTLWRMMINEDLSQGAGSLREALSAGEPLNPEVIERIRAAWGLTIREGYGQTETTLLAGNFPGQIVKPGSMGKVAPGYRIELRPTESTDHHDPSEGEIAVSLAPRPLGLMVGYLDDPAKMAAAEAEGCYRTGDVATRDADGYLTYVGRADDVFKSAGYRLSPFELESVLIEHPAVAEAAVTESPDPVRGVVPKAFVALRAGFTPGRELAGDILRFVRERVAPYRRIRRIEFAELPKTISGKIRRVELRLAERRRVDAGQTMPLSFAEEEFADR
ncbi:MAG: AMP-binding protein [Gemmatimonadetes bacterium]|nr:AMP-binding protein [Gemmatimonadota bacterium]